MYTILVSTTFQKQFKAFQKNLQKRIKSALKELEEDPYEPRSGADIKPLTKTKPRKHRLRVGDYRIIYMVEDNTVKIIEVFRRGKGYKDVKS